MRPKNNSDQRTLSAFHHLMNSTSAGNLLSKDFIATTRNQNNNTDQNFHTITSSSSLMRKMKS